MGVVCDLSIHHDPFQSEIIGGFEIDTQRLEFVDPLELNQTGG